MKLLIASDLHGSFCSLKKLIENMEKEKPDKVLFLGDILYHGPRNDLPLEYSPKECIKVLNEHKEMFTCVRGNCDAEVDQMVLEFPILDEGNVLRIDDMNFYMTHGHHYNDKMPLDVEKKSVVLFGHTHVPMSEYVNGVLYVNPGSLSIPKENSVKSFMIYENGTFYWKDLEGNTYKTLKIEF